VFFFFLVSFQKSLFIVFFDKGYCSTSTNYFYFTNWKFPLKKNLIFPLLCTDLNYLCQYEITGIYFISPLLLLFVAQTVPYTTVEGPSNFLPRVHSYQFAFDLILSWVFITRMQKYSYSFYSLKLILFLVLITFL
jgi:hypothetical protein